MTIALATKKGNVEFKTKVGTAFNFVIPHNLSMGADENGHPKTVTEWQPCMVYSSAFQVIANLDGTKGVQAGKKYVLTGNLTPNGQHEYNGKSVPRWVVKNCGLIREIGKDGEIASAQELVTATEQEELDGAVVPF